MGRAWIRLRVAGEGSAGLLAEFRTWLDRERGLAVSVRCYSSRRRRCWPRSAGRKR
jgi:hypothetical protein